MMLSPSFVRLSTLTRRPASALRGLGVSLAFSLAGPLLAQTTWHVDASAAGPGSGTALDPFPSIQTAIEQPTTVDGDTVLVHPGTYPELVDLLDKEIVLASSGGAGVTVIEVVPQVSLEMSAVKIRGGQGPACRVEGFTLTKGEGTLLTEPVEGLQRWVGGGLLVLDSSPSVVGCILRDGDTDLGAGAYVQGGQPTFVDCQFLTNVAVRSGGGLHASLSQVTLIDVTMRGNRGATGDGGAVQLFGGSLSMQSSNLQFNFASVGGRGGNMALRFGATADVVDSILSKGSASDGEGGGVWIEGSSASFLDCSFTANRAGDPASNRHGGAISAVGASLGLVGCLFEDNYSAKGGALFLEGSTASVSGCTFKGNLAESGGAWFTADGGAVAATSTSLTLSKCVFSANRAECRSPGINGAIARGGALWCDTPGVQASFCAFLDNRAFYDGWPDWFFSKVEPGAQGGAIFGPASVLRSRLIGNRADSDPVSLNGRAEGGAAWGATLVASLLQANEVAGIGPVPDVGPAAEASALTCCTLVGNLPASLPALGPLCSSSCP